MQRKGLRCKCPRRKKSLHTCITPAPNRSRASTATSFTLPLPFAHRCHRVCDESDTYIPPNALARRLRPSRAISHKIDINHALTWSQNKLGRTSGAADRLADLLSLPIHDNPARPRHIFATKSEFILPAPLDIHQPTIRPLKFPRRILIPAQQDRVFSLVADMNDPRRELPRPPNVRKPVLILPPQRRDHFRLLLRQIVLLAAIRDQVIQLQNR